MTSRTAQRISRVGGLVLGLGLAATLVLVSTPSTRAAGLTATVRFTVPMSGELAVTPPAPRAVLLADGLRPGSRPRTGGFRVRNQTGKTIRLRFRADRLSTGLDGLVQVRLTVAGRPLADASLQGLAGSSGTLRVASGGTRRIELRAWMPSNVGDGYEGRQVDVSLMPVIVGGGG